MKLKKRKVKKYLSLIFYIDNYEENQEELTNTKLNFSIPPNEDSLTLHTLWPEMNKFYGHSFEIKSIAC